MNQLYRALHMPPARLAKKLAGWKEVYTIAVRPVPAEPGHEPLPALGGGGLYPAARHTRALVCRPAALPPRRGALAVLRGF